MKQYLKLLQDILVNGESHDDRTGVGTYSVFGRQIRFNLKEGFPLLTTKKLPLRWIAEELFWFLSGSTNEKDLRDKGVDIWKEWATKEQCQRFNRQEGDLGPVYGALWRNYPIGNYYDLQSPSLYDQIENLLYDIKNSSNSRRLIVSGWHPYYQKMVALPPCHTLFQFKVHKTQQYHVNELSCHLYARSIDSFLGLPFNIASYALLLSLVAHVSNLLPKELIISFGDVHIYKNHLEQVREQLTRTPRQLPQLQIKDHLKEQRLEGLLACTWNDIRLIGYDPHPTIKAEVAV